MLNFFKKLISAILSLVMLIAITGLCSIFVIRTLLSGANVIDLALKSANVSDIKYSDVLSNLTGQDLNGDLSAYIDDEELKTNLEDFITNTLKYYSGVKDVAVPSVDALKEQINNSIDKYEEKTGKKINRDQVDEAFKNLDTEVAQSIGVTNSEEIKTIFNFIYSNKLVIFLLILIIAIIVIKILMFHSIIELLKSIIVIVMFNSFGNFGFGIALKSLFKTSSEPQIDIILKNITSSFNKIALISLIIALTFSIILIIIKVIKKNKNKKEHLANDSANNITNNNSYSETNPNNTDNLNNIVNENSINNDNNN